MSSALERHAANLIVAVRTALVFLIVLLWSAPSPSWRAAGLWVLALALAMDGLDGWVARRLKTESRLGGLIDTVGDRITENVLLVFLAYERVVPLFVPLVFLARAFVSDLVRYLNHARGETTFSVNRSALGAALVASAWSRVLYLLLKMAVFFAGGAALAASSSSSGPHPAWTAAAGRLSVALVAFNLLRFVLLLYDSRATLAAAAEEGR